MGPDPEPDVDVRDATLQMAKQALALERNAAGALSDATSLRAAVARLSTEAESLHLAFPDPPAAEDDPAAGPGGGTSPVPPTAEPSGVWREPGFAGRAVQARPTEGPAPVAPRAPRTARWPLVLAAVLGGAAVAMAVVAIQLVDRQLQNPPQLAQAPAEPVRQVDTPIAPPALPLPVEPVVEPALVPLQESAPPVAALPSPAPAATRAPAPPPIPAPAPSPTPQPAATRTPPPAPPGAPTGSAAEPAALAASVRSELL